MSELYNEYSGAEFNKANKGTKFYKFFSDDLIHYRFKYKSGLNVDDVPFNPSKECSKGGLHFCEEHKRHLHYTGYFPKLALIEIPDNARVYIEKDKFKADRLIIKQITNYINDDNFWIDLIPDNGLVLKHVKYQTEEICKLAVQQDGYALRYVMNQTYDICKLAVQQYGRALRFVKNRTEELCVLAVKQNGLALEYVPKQTEDICKLAVQQNGLALDYVKEQTNDICAIAVKQNGLVLELVKEQTDEICTLAVQQNWLALKYVKKQTEKICMLAVEQNNFASHFINNQIVEGN